MTMFMIVVVCLARHGFVFGGGQAPFKVLPHQACALGAVKKLKLE